MNISKKLSSRGIKRLRKLGMSGPTPVRKVVIEALTIAEVFERGKVTSWWLTRLVSLKFFNSSENSSEVPRGPIWVQKYTAVKRLRTSDAPVVATFKA
jgi:hypothetical protein